MERKDILAAVVLSVFLATSALAFKPVTYTRADAQMRTVETWARIPVYADASQTLSVDGVVALILPGDGGTSGSTTSFAPPPYSARLRVEAYDAGSASSPLTCTSCSVTGYNTLGVPVSEVVEDVDEDETLTQNSYERVTAFSCSGCANFDADDTLKLHASDHVGVGVPISGASDVLAVCFMETDDPASNSDCVPGAECTVDQPSHSVDVGSCTVIGGDSAAWTASDNMSIRIRARASAQPVNLYAR